MESILRGAATYLFIWLIFRVTGKRTLAQITTFDAVLLLIISETTQAALVDNDNSFTNSVLLVLTMLGIDVVLSCAKERFSAVQKLVDGVPLVLFDSNGFHKEVMHKERVREDDIMHAVRELQGLSRLDQIRYAILEQTGEITIIPKQG
jgi:uncharacterized membrane protein YcaP (DUF421 family)